MNIEDLKDVLGENYEAVSSYIKTLEDQRDVAVKQSEDGRQKFKRLAEERESLRKTKDRLFDRLGITEDEELDALPDLKGQAEAAKVYEAKLKRVERELADKTSVLQQTQTQFRDSQLSAMLSKSIGGHEWVDRDVVELAIRSRIEWEDDQPMYRTDKGMVSLDDGVRLFASEKPSLLRSHGAGGSGYVKTSAGSVPNPWAPQSFNLTEQGRLMRENPTLAQTLKAGVQRN